MMPLRQLVSGGKIISDLREFAKNLLIVQFGSVKFYTDRTFNIVQFPRLWRIIGLFSSSIGIYSRIFGIKF
jgi:hypothetical protein